MNSDLSIERQEMIVDFLHESREFIVATQDILKSFAKKKYQAKETDLRSIQQTTHAIKLGARFLELKQLAIVAEAADLLVDRLRTGKEEQTSARLKLFCRAFTFFTEAFDTIAATCDDQPLEGAAEALRSALNAAITLDEELPAGILTEAAVNENFNPFNTPELVEKFVGEGDELLQNAELGLLRWETSPEDEENLGALFRDIHSFKGNSGFLGFSDLEKLSHQLEAVLEIAKSGRDLSEFKAANVLLGYLDIMRAALADIARQGSGHVPDLDVHLMTLLDLLERIDSDAPSAAPLRLATAGAADTEQSRTIKRQDIRVDLSKLDQLINLIGELVIAENMLVHSPELAGLELEQFHRASRQMNKIVRDLQEVAMTIRMVPISGLFRRLLRLVHDLSVKSGKKVDLSLTGEDTEVDKTVAELMTDPLVHLIRNALDHGIESPAERKAGGKPDKGSLQLSARHEEGEIWIILEDDGRGLSREKILARAATKGLLNKSAEEMSDREVWNMIFLPGFSTAEQITDISGRGVGMDVVKKNIEKIKGKVELTSTPNQGTRFTLRIPLTLGIIDGMLLRVGSAKCIIPTLAINQAFRPTPAMITVTPDGLELVRVRERFYPVVRLHQILANAPEFTELSAGILLTLEHQGAIIALFVDELLGQQQTVIKGLSEHFENARWVTGCTILGDGEVCLILDVGHLVDTHGHVKIAQPTLTA